MTKEQVIQKINNGYKFGWIPTGFTRIGDKMSEDGFYILKDAAKAHKISKKLGDYISEHWCVFDDTLSTYVLSDPAKECLRQREVLHAF